MGKILRVILFLLFFTFMHTFIFGVLIFNVYPTNQEAPFSYSVESLTTASQQTTYATLLEDRAFSFDTRLALLSEARESIDVSYFAVHGGETRDIFYGALLNAADRGIKVRFVIDGVVHDQHFDDKLYFDAIIAHENIDVAFYEPYHLLRPHTAQNRLHDKLIIVDHQYGLTGGRNIGNRYYKTLENPREMTYDRDILIFGENAEHETVVEMKNYFDELFNYKHNRYLARNESDTLIEAQDFMRTAYLDYQSNLEYDAIMQHLYDEAFTVKKASFIRSPLERMHKYPVVFETLVNLGEEADEWIIQSPYLIFNKPMMNHLPTLDNKTITVLTNNIHENPNALALSGYIRYRGPIAEATRLYEFQNQSSLHAKTFIFGDDVTAIGSLNIDPRSYSLSTESMIIIYDEAFTAHMKDVLDGYFDQSLEVGNDGEYIPKDGVTAMSPRPIRHALVRALAGITVFFDTML